jgi:hypothetical protein
MRGQWLIRYLTSEEVASFEPRVVVWQRTSVPDEGRLAAVTAVARKLNALTIYDLDDNLLDIDDEAERLAYVEKLKAVEASLRVAEQIWCSTSPLVERVSTMSRHVPLLMPNALDPSLWMGASKNSPAETDVFRMMYMGTRTHSADLGMLSVAMDRLESKHPGRFKLEVVGVANCHTDQAWMKVVQIPEHVGASYPAFVSWLRAQGGQQLGVAPLLSSPFNSCKSHIKVLDYAALGLPALTSDVQAYQPLQADVECYKCGNEPELWVTEIERIRQRPTFAAAVLNNARLRVTERAFVEATQLRIDAIESGLAGHA